MSIIIYPHTTVAQLAQMLDENKGRDMEVYVRIESIRGKPVGYLVREPRIPVSHLPAMLRRQGD